MQSGTILVTGASSGIGAALARHYAQPGLNLILWGRNKDRLEAVAEACRAKGAVCKSVAFDLCDFAILKAELAAAGTPDIAILNAGMGGSLPPGRAAQDPEAAERMAAVNFTVPVIAANHLAQAMAERGSGRIVMIGSVAAAFPLPMAPVYSGTKAGLAVFAEGLSLRLSKFGVGVTLVAPGFVDTPMSQSLREPRPFVISADTAAKIIIRNIARGRSKIIVPWPFAVLCAICGLLPRPLLRAAIAMTARRTSN